MSIAQAEVVGVGAVTGYGWSTPSLWHGLRSGKPAPRLHRNLGDRFPAACWLARIPEGGDEQVALTRYGRACFASAQEAVEDAGRRGWKPGSRVGIVHATTRADLELVRARYQVPDQYPVRRSYVEQTWTTAPALLMMKHQFTGPVIVVSAACASGVHALAIAQRLLASGDASDVIVTGAEVGSDGEELQMFAAVGALHYDRPPLEVCRPLQEGSKGFVLGEGVATVVLTTCNAESGQSSYLSLLGSAFGNDAYHPVSIRPDGGEILRVVDDALGRADVTAQDLDYYCAHASGTEECTRADTQVLTHLGKDIPAYGFKPLLGHCISAAGLLETIIIAIANVEHALPAPPKLAPGHPQLVSGPVDYRGGTTLQLGLGWGGNISAAVYRTH